MVVTLILVVTFVFPNIGFIYANDMLEAEQDKMYNVLLKEVQDDSDKDLILNLAREYHKISQDYDVEQIKNNIKNLRILGISEDDLEDITIKEIQDIIKEANTYYTDGEDDSYIAKTANKMEINYELVMKEKGLTVEEINLLCNLSYSPKAIYIMSSKELNYILEAYSDQLVSTRSTHTYYGTIPYFGEADNSCTFDSSIRITASAIDVYCTRAKQFAEFVFNTAYNNASSKNEQNIQFSYFLYGEADPGIHEGVDIRHNIDNHHSIRSAHIGTVGNSGGAYGVVQIYDEAIDSTITYMHMRYCTPASSVGLYQTIGQQSDVTDAEPIAEHLHIQVETGENYTIETGTNSVLESDFPYFVMTWNL